jgi:hypothetical protein
MRVELSEMERYHQILSTSVVLVNTESRSLSLSLVGLSIEEIIAISPLWMIYRVEYLAIEWKANNSACGDRMNGVSKLKQLLAILTQPPLFDFCL